MSEHEPDSLPNVSVDTAEASSLPRRLGRLAAGGTLALIVALSGGCGGPTIPRDTWTRPADGMLMVFVPAGEFEMGSSEGASDEQPVHTVVLDGFWIDRTEVTVAEFREFVEATGHETTAEREGSGTIWDYKGLRSEIEGANWEHPEGQKGWRADDEDPVVQVSWDDAAAYCEWAGATLPTEAQWEYAARGPEERRYPWGNTFDGTRLNWCDAGCHYDWRDRLGPDDGYDYVAPVGSFRAGASWCGALDLAGNVSEWVADWYGDYPSGSQTNPTGPATGEYRVLRGCSFSCEKHVLAATSRSGGTPDFRDDSVGFRCVVLPGG